MAIERRYLEVDGLNTFYLTAGNGHPVVMIHGGSPGVCSLVAWKLNMEPLAASGLCLYAFDQAGFGNTDNPADYSMDYRVTHARKFIDALGLERFHLLGNSMGAYIAARIALEDPRAERLVLISSGTLSPPGSAAAVAQGKKHARELREYTPSLDNMRAVTLKTLFRSELVTDELVAERYEMSTGSRFDAIVKRWQAPPSEARGGTPVGAPEQDAAHLGKERPRRGAGKGRAAVRSAPGRGAPRLQPLRPLGLLGPGGAVQPARRRLPVAAGLTACGHGSLSLSVAARSSRYTRGRV